MPMITNQSAGILVLLAILILYVFFGGKKGRIALIATLLTALFIDPICHYIVKPLFARPRPCMIEDVRLLVDCVKNYSMPSLHAANIFGFATSLTVFFGWCAAPLYLIAFLVAYSRIYVGVHWPSDTIVGALIGIAIGVFVGFIFKRIFTKRKNKEAIK